MRKEIKLLLMPLFILILAGTVNPTAVTCTISPTATTAGTRSTYIDSTDQFFNVTIAGVDGAAGDNATGANITINTGTITGSLIHNQSGAQTNRTYFNFTVNTMALVDTTTYTFTVTIVNNTMAPLGTACTVALIPDNTVPVVSLGSPSDGSTDTDGEVTIAYTCTNASSANIYLEDSGGYTRYTMTESSDNCSYSATLLTNGLHSHYIVGSDGLNSTTSTTSTVEVRIPGGYIYDEQGQIMIETAGSTTPIKSKNAVTNIINTIFETIFGIFDKIFSAIKG